MQNSNGKWAGGLGKPQPSQDYLIQEMGKKWFKFSEVPIGSAWILERALATAERQLIPKGSLFTVTGVSSTCIEALIGDRVHSLYADTLSFSSRVA